MVLYQDIAKAVTMVIKEAFPNIPIYGDEVREGYKTPSFFVGIMPVNSINHTKSIKEEQLLITVSYFSNTTESLKNYKVMQELKVAFGQVLSVDNRRFIIQETNTEKVGEDGDNYQFIFDINYYELASSEPDGELVKEIIYN
ncbi:hypothetical protein QTL86_09185 [Cellulosilyticum sp. ST5]|uniref:phage tail terminator family protein n=1 Tax=Cellulosilyticum sp. ST5 TaxID=3055805 RepID=UPI0039779109